MHLAVIDNDANVAGIRTCERALLHSAHDAFQYGWHEACINGTTNDGVDEDELSAPFQINLFLSFRCNLKFLVAELVAGWLWHAVVIWLYNKMHFAKLACATRLFLVAIVGTCSLCDGLAIRNLRFLKANVDFLVVFHTPFQGAQMEFSLAFHESLLQLFRLLDNPCWVFLRHLLNGGYHLFCVGFVLGFDSADVFRIRILDKIEAMLAVFACQRVSCTHVLQLDRTADITSHHLFYLDSI